VIAIAILVFVAIVHSPKIEQLKNVGADLQPTNTVLQIASNKYSFEQGNPLFNDPVIARSLFKTHAHITRATKHNWFHWAKKKGSRSSLVLLSVSHVVPLLCDLLHQVEADECSLMIFWIKAHHVLRVAVERLVHKQAVECGITANKLSDDLGDGLGFHIVSFQVGAEAPVAYRQ
jgi:hypothetical protein